MRWAELSTRLTAEWHAEHGLKEGVDVAFFHRIYRLADCTFHDRGEGICEIFVAIVGRSLEGIFLCERLGCCFDWR
jgi:hypothetical protein